MAQLTTLSQLGARLSIARWHVEAIRRSEPDSSVNHILYIVDPRNEQLTAFARGQQGNFTVYDRTENTWTDFTNPTGSAFGGDSNYDFLLRRPEVGEIFLTMHDDSIVRSAGVWARLRELASEYHFGGYLDARGVPQYEHLYLDGVKMSDLRIGTWFCFGQTRHYLARGYTIGDYRNYPKWFLNWKYRTFRISADGWKVWLNGGFDLNIKARLNGDRFCILDGSQSSVLAEHWNKITGFFVKRKLLDYADTSEEVGRWAAYLRELRQRDETQFEFDVGYLGRLAAEIAGAGIHDPLLNPDQIDDFRTRGR